MSVQAVTPVLNVSSLPASFAWFEALGWRRGFSWNEAGMIGDAADRNEHGEARFGSVCSHHATIFLCRDAQGSRGSVLPRWPGDEATDGVWMSWWMADAAAVDALHALALARGLSISLAPRDQPWGIREFHLRHPDGHTFRVSGSLGAA